MCKAFREPEVESGGVGRGSLGPQGQLQAADKGQSPAQALSEQCRAQPGVCERDGRARLGKPGDREPPTEALGPSPSHGEEKGKETNLDKGGKC